MYLKGIIGVKFISVLLNRDPAALYIKDVFQNMSNYPDNMKGHEGML